LEEERDRWAEEKKEHFERQEMMKKMLEEQRNQYANELLSQRMETVHNAGRMEEQLRAYEQRIMELRLEYRTQYAATQAEKRRLEGKLWWWQ
jgi:hypothetical protein